MLCALSHFKSLWRNNLNQFICHASPLIQHRHIWATITLYKELMWTNYMSRIIINSWPSYPENMNIWLCYIFINIYQWLVYFLLPIKHNLWDIWRLWSCLIFSKSSHIEVVFNACVITWECCISFKQGINCIQVAYFWFIHVCMNVYIHI